VFVDIQPYVFTGQVNVSSSDDQICAGESVSLYSSGSSYLTVLERETFNGSFSSWTTSNASTGGTPASAAWTLRPDDYDYDNNFSSNDASQFYLSNSRAQGGGTTSTVLKSPAMNTIGFTTLSMDFYQFFDARTSGDNCKVQVSTNNLTWTDLATYTTDQGDFDNFINSTITLNSYVGQPSVWVRFLFTASNDRYWAIDNVTIAGNSTRYTYNWTSVPAGFVSTEQNTLNYQPTVSAFYDVSVMNNYGCVINTSPIPVVVNPLPLDNAGGNVDLCSGVAGTIGAPVQAGSTYSWSPSAGLSSATVAQPEANPSSSVWYTLTETITATGCSDTNQVFVRIRPMSVVSNISTTSCSGSAFTVSPIDGANGTIISGTQYVWDQPTGVGISGGSAQTASQSSISQTLTSSVNTSTAAIYQVTPRVNGCDGAPFTVQVDVAPQSAPGTITGATAVCADANSTALAVENSIGQLQWQSSTDNVNFTNLNGETSNLYNAVNVGSATYYRVVATNNPCQVATGNSVAITVLPRPTASIAGTTSICPGSPVAVELSLSGSGPWSGTLSNGQSFTSSTAQTSITVNASTTQTLTISSLSDANCAATNGLSGSATVTVLGNTTWYYDFDGDGYSQSGMDSISCNNPGAGYASSRLGVDCDDNDALVWRSSNVFVDEDGDGYKVGSISSICYGASLPSGYVLAGAAMGTDCDDTDESIYTIESLNVDVDGDGYSPGLDFVCMGEVVPVGYAVGSLGYDYCDQDSTTWNRDFVLVDADGDGYAVGNTFNLCYGASLPAGYVFYGAQLGATDCDDNDASVFNTQIVMLDDDEDGYSLGLQFTICAGDELPAGYVLVSAVMGTDCDDDDDEAYQSDELYHDEDGDGYTVGSPEYFCYGSSVPAGFTLVSLGEDCDDFNENEFQELNLFADSDGDGYTWGSASWQCIGALVPTGFVATSLGADVDDTDGTVWRSNTFYTDADGDGYYGNATTIQYGSIVPPGSITTLGLDCNDSNFAVNLAAFEVCENMIDDDCDGSVDEFCNTTIGNDSPTYALAVQYSVNMNYPNCYPISGTLGSATDSPQSTQFTGSDVWYRFVAQSTAVSISISSTGADDYIALYTRSGSVYTQIDFENASNGLADFERMNYNGLTAGETYYISVGSVSGTGGAFTLCIQHLMPSGCSSVEPVGGFSLCDAYKARYRGAPSQGVTYTFSFTGIGGGAQGTTVLSQTNGLVSLSNPTLALRWGGEYNAKVDVRYNISNSNGIAEPIDVFGSFNAVNCSNITISAHPAMEVRQSQRCPASLLRSNFLVGDRMVSNTAICGVTNYTYEFTQVAGCSNSTVVSVFPQAFTTVASTPYLSLGVLPNLTTAGVWDVRIRPNFSYGAGSYGPARRISVNGTAASAVMDEMADLTDRSLTEDADAELFPNPANGSTVWLNFNQLMNEQVQMRVLDMTGRVVLTQQYRVEGSLQAEISIENLSNGMYVVELLDGDKKHDLPLVIQH
jgi:hypothetical protein